MPVASCWMRRNGVDDGQAPAHHPRWKERVPRDNGSGWDFEDVRDHYAKELYGLDPMRLRYADVERYLALGRVVVGELMAATFAGLLTSVGTSLAKRGFGYIEGDHYHPGYVRLSV